ncbi:MAG: hypothetical protein ACI85I_002411 [Arenicella sp.]
MEVATAIFSIKKYFIRLRLIAESSHKLEKDYPFNNFVEEKCLKKCYFFQCKIKDSFQIVLKPGLHKAYINIEPVLPNYYHS